MKYLSKKIGNYKRNSGSINLNRQFLFLVILGFFVMTPGIPKDPLYCGDSLEIVQIFENLSPFNFFPKNSMEAQKILLIIISTEN